MHDNPLLAVLRDATEALAEAGVDHALIGGVAAILHGSARATRDVDISVDVLDEEALRVGLAGHGFRDVIRRGSVIQAAHRSGFRLDLLVVHGAFERRIIAAALDRPVANIGVVRLARVEDVIAFKLLAGRPRDVRDIEALTEENPELEWARVSALVAELGVQTDPAAWSAAASADELRAMVKRVATAIRS